MICFICGEEHKARGKLLKFTRSEEFLLHYLGKAGEASLANIQHDTGFNRKELVILLTKLVRFDVVEMQFREGSTVFLLKDAPGA